MTLCMCPVCGDELGLQDSVVMTDEGWAHKRCGRAELAVHGVSFVAPRESDERLVAKIAHCLYGKVIMRDDHATQSAAAEDYARNLATVLVLDFEITERT